jgi:tRNA A-37 threonylcarbamoyl transferase component Bud32/lipoprotein NlpI
MSDRPQERFANDVPLAASLDTTETVPYTLTGSGQLIKGRYRLLRQIGRGGMAAVYLAEDCDLGGRKVVVKVLLKQPENSEYYHRKFSDEQAALAKIDHPGVVGVFDAGTLPDQRPFLVLQYVEGVTLAARIPAKGMEVQTAANILRQIGSALEAAHAKHICHRDLKPDNIMLQLPGNAEILVKVIDFGIATLLTSRLASGSTEAAGTFPYMAPEQLHGVAEPAADLFSFGIVVWKMLTGETPQQIRSYADLLQLPNSGWNESLRQHKPEIPEEAEKLISQALQPDPRLRPVDARQFAAALADALVAGREPRAIAEIGQQSSRSTREIKANARQAARRLILSAPLMAGSLIFCALISYKFLVGVPDITAFVVTFSLALLYLSIAGTLTQTGRHWLERIGSRFHFSLQLCGRRRLIMPLLFLFAVAIFYFSLPNVARIYNDRGYRFQQNRNFASAIWNYERAIQLDAVHAEAHYNLATAFEDTMQLDRAVTEYQAALRADPEFYHAYNNLARLYIVSRKEYDVALKILNAALAFRPQETFVRYTLSKNRGWAHVGLGLRDLAADDLTQALSWRHDGAAAHCLLAQVLEGQNKPETALKEWEACVAYAPGDVDVEASWLSVAQTKLKRVNDPDTR